MNQQSKPDININNVYFGQIPSGYDSPLGFQNAPISFDEGAIDANKSIKNINMDDLGIEKNDPFGNDFD